MVEKVVVLVVEMVVVEKVEELVVDKVEMVNMVVLSEVSVEEAYTGVNNTESKQYDFHYMLYLLYCCQDNDNI